MKVGDISLTLSSLFPSQMNCSWIFYSTSVKKKNKKNSELVDGKESAVYRYRKIDKMNECFQGI